MKFTPSDVITLVDGEGSFATMAEAFPALFPPGHVSVRVDLPERPLVVLGDVVVHEVQLGDPDLVYVSDHDPLRAAATRKEFLGELADEGAEVIVSHFAGAGRLVRGGGGFRWARSAKEDGAPVE